MKEVWKPVPGYDNYLVSLNGVKSLNYRNKKKEMILTPGISQGHLVYTLSRNNVHKTFGLHVLVWLAFVGPIPEGSIVHHVNENPLDNRIENLKLVSKDKQYNFIKEFKSITEAAGWLGKERGQSNIYCCLNGKTSSAYGFVWCFKKEAAS